MLWNFTHFIIVLTQIFFESMPNKSGFDFLFTLFILFTYKYGFKHKNRKLVRFKVKVTKNSRITLAGLYSTYLYIRLKKWFSQKISYLNGVASFFGDTFEGQDHFKLRAQNISGIHVIQWWILINFVGNSDWPEDKDTIVFTVNLQTRQMSCTNSNFLQISQTSFKRYFIVADTECNGYNFGWTH